MTANRRLAILERDVGNLLIDMGYDAVIVSDCFPPSKFIPYNLIARTTKGSGDSNPEIWVKIKVGLHRFTTPEQAASFCRDEIRVTQKFYQRVAGVKNPPRYEIWISVPESGFQRFEVTIDGFRELPAPAVPQPAGGPA